MEKLIHGLHHFQSNVFSSYRHVFAQLVHGQKPQVLFITCSDSRISPNMITQTGPGELFILRNAGNLVPPYGASNGGEAATIEYAVAGLKVPHVVVCGHSHCGAMHGLLDRDSLRDLPAVSAWLNHAEATRRIVMENYQGLDERALLTAAIEENVLIQLENLRTHPAVAVRLARQELSLHAWVYQIETGKVFDYDPTEEEFLPLDLPELPKSEATGGDYL